MQENRQDYRKKFTSTGDISLAGELLEFVSYDVSVQGIQIELQPGKFINSVNDVRDLLLETQEAEIFVHNLGLSAISKIAWVLEDEGKVHLGLEFIEVRHNVTKLWRKRRCFRKKLVVDAKFQLDKQEVNAQTIDISADGVRLTCTAVENLKVGDIIKLFVPDKDINALAVVIWLNSSASSVEFGVRYISVT